LIKKLRPDVIHSQEIQHSGYLMMQACKYFKGKLPPWIVTNWGSDIYFFGQLAAHAPRIRAVLENCDYYSCETERDRQLAVSYGFRGEVLLPIIPNPGGFRFEELDPLRRPGPTSQRRMILVKGYQGMFGRALSALYALELCQDLLRDYKIVVYSAAPAEVPNAAEILAGKTGLNIEVVPHTNHYGEILRLRGQARISIGLSVSDAASISFLEALALGAFPIQSDRGGAHEWIRDGEGGFLVPPEDPQILAAAMRRALTEADLVDRAAENNYRLARERLEFYQLRQHVIRWYEQIVERNTPMPIPVAPQPACKTETGGFCSRAA
jgi:glycosyltransferase involved in cell wall biosynthesis